MNDMRRCIAITVGYASRRFFYVPISASQSNC